VLNAFLSQARKELTGNVSDGTPVAVMGSSRMLLDTVNLDPNAGRATPRDVDIDHRLLEIMGQSPSIEYNELVRARTSVDGLTNDQLL
jgi:hypothetical protein